MYGLISSWDLFLNWGKFFIIYNEQCYGLASLPLFLQGFLLLFVVYQPKNEIPYYAHDDSVEDYFTKINVEPYKGRKDRLFQV